MNEPKRRGRPPKAKPCEECGQVGSHYDDCSAGMGVADMATAIYDEINAQIDRGLQMRAQAYAMRVWNSQAPQVPRAERIRRVKVALEGQNLPFEGVTLP